MGRLKLTSGQLKWMLSLTAVAFLLRLLSPISTDFLTKPLSWPPVRADGYGYPFQYPNGYVFDEVYFAQDACRDLRGLDYLDPEPPLSKLVIAGGMIVTEPFMHYDRGAAVPAGKECEAAGTFSSFGTWGWRFTSLILGTLLIPLIFLIALRLWNNTFFAGAAAFFMTFDGMSFVQSRIAMIDVVAIFFLLIAYLAFLVHREAKTDKEFTRTGLLLGLAIGLAVAAKWVTLAAWGTMIIFLVGGWLLRYVRISVPGAGWSIGREPERQRRLPGPQDWGVRLLFYVGVLVAIPVAIYLISFFRYATIAHCIPDVCAGGSPLSVPSLALARLHVAGLTIWLPKGVNVVEYIRQIWQHDHWAYEYHKNLTATHPYGSAWYSWPLMLRPVLYYAQYNIGLDSVNGQQLRATIFNLGNPAIWWGAIPAMVYCAVVAIKERSLVAALIVVGYLTAWLPFSRVTRVMFLYHMFGSLPFMMLALAFGLARLKQRFSFNLELGSIRLPAVTGGQLALAYCGLVLLLFIFFYPLWTGLPITGDGWSQRIWLDLHTDTKISWI